mmetsp:Transcript_5310/g.7187  ORF Transcript_5310/g.7187 Transcript_5310/m.7187 type:complete len:94 (-) Transcript_5310:204-485(-)
MFGRCSKQFCSIHSREPAVIQCCDCVRLGCEEQSFHCSPTCFQINWNTHKQLHENALRARQAEVLIPVKVKFTTPTKSRNVTIHASTPIAVKA